MAAVKIFISYARIDEKYRVELDKHLEILKQSQLIDLWYDRIISPGENWQQQIDMHLSAAQIILLLVSPDFLASKYCYGYEMQKALEMDKQHRAKIIPIIIRPCSWEDTPLKALQVAPKDALPVVSWVNPDAAYLDVVRGVRQAIIDLQVDYWLQKAKDYFDNQKYTECFVACGEALKLDRTSDRTYIRRGEMYYKLSKYEDALRDYDQAIKYKPGQTSYLNMKGQVLLTLKRYDDALQAYEKAAEDPNNIFAALRCCQILIRLNNYPRALGTIEKAIHAEQAQKQSQVYYMHSLLLAEANRFEEARAAFQRAETLPITRAAHSTRGDALYALKDYKAAVIAYEQAIKADEKNAAVYTGKGNALTGARTVYRGAGGLSKGNSAG